MTVDSCRNNEHATARGETHGQTDRLTEIYIEDCGSTYCTTCSCHFVLQARNKDKDMPDVMDLIPGWRKDGDTIVKVKREPLEDIKAWPEEDDGDCGAVKVKTESRGDSELLPSWSDQGTISGTFEEDKENCKTWPPIDDDNYSCTSTSDSESIQGPQIVGYSMKREESVKPLSIKLENSR